MTPETMNAARDEWLVSPDFDDQAQKSISLVYSPDCRSPDPDPLYAVLLFHVALREKFRNDPANLK